MMQKYSNMKWQGISVFFIATLLLATLLISVSVATPALAQDGSGPTPTPNDPLWRAFVTARGAVEEERSVDLTMVQKYTFDQEEYTHGIDWGCDDDVIAVDVRPVYFGWTFRITDLGGRTHQVRVSFDLRAVSVCDKVTVGAAAPVAEDPVVVGDLNLPAPVAGSGATGAFELGGHVTWLTDQAVSAMNQSGMTWVKKQLRYHRGDNAEGLANSFVADAHSKGFKILLGVVGYPNEMDMNNFDAYVESYADFCGQVAAKGADAIEVWNEPNIDREWPTGHISGANYTKLLAACFNRIKTVNPDIMVISAAMAPTGAEAAFPGAVVNDDNFMRQMAEAGAASYMDCVGLHYNEGIVSPGATVGDPRDSYPTRYFGSMLARGRQSFPGLPVCWTELGYLSPQGFTEALPAFFAWAGDVTVAQQAAWLADAASRSAAAGVRLMIVWNVNFEGITDDPMGGYAMIRPDGTCPACSMLGAVMGK